MLKKTIPILSIISAAAILFIAANALTNLPVPQSGEPVDTEDEIQEQKQVVIGYIECANSVSAQAAFDKLLTDYGDNDLVVPAVYEIGEKFREKAQYNFAISAHKYIVDNFPESEQAVWAQRGLAASYIGLGDMESAQIQTQKLIDNYIKDPNIAQSVFEVADTYCWFGKNDRARSLYQMVIGTWPTAQHSMWSQMGIAISFIADGNDLAAKEATDNLILNYGDNVKLPEALFYIAGRYAWSKKYDDAYDIFQYIADNFPQSIWAENAVFESHKNNVYQFLDNRDEPNALSAIDSFIEKYKEKPDLPAVVYDFGARADWQANYEPNDLTKKIFGKVIEEFPASPDAVNAQMGLARMEIQSLIDANDDVNSFAAIDKLVSDFNGCPDLTMAVSLIGENYYAKGLKMQNAGLQDLAAENYEKSIIIREIVIQQLPFSEELTPRAYYLSAVLYSHYLQQYEKGIEYFQKVVETWPDYQFAWNAQFFIGLYYEILRNSGAISQSEANPKIEQAYKAVVENYPDSEPAGHVAFKLGWMYFQQEQWEQAIRYFEFFLDRFPDQLGTVIWPLGQAYEKTGQSETAIDYYQAFIELTDPNDPQVKNIKTRLQIL